MVSLNWPRSGKGESFRLSFREWVNPCPILRTHEDQEWVYHSEACTTWWRMFLGWTKSETQDRRKNKNGSEDPFLLSIVEYAVLHIDFAGFAEWTVFGKDKFLDNDCPALEEVPETLARIGRVNGLQDFILKGRPPFKGFAVVLIERTPQEETRG